MAIKENSKGHAHPLSKTIQDIVYIFDSLGFEVALGPEIESEYNNFDALNVAKDHPARDMQDTFWLKKNNIGDLLRTHISAHQVPYMKENTPPFMMVSPGKVYRNEATDATHEAHYHYVEGLAIGEKGTMTLGHLKGTLEAFLKKLFSEDVEFRFRPGFFPFVEPGVEVDMRRGEKWLEVLGAGIVHPIVLKNAGIDPEKYRGFAFGMGADRMMMLRHGIPDVRLSYQGDLRFVNQF